MRPAGMVLTAASLLLALALTGCGAKDAEASGEKGSYYEILDAEGTVLYTVTKDEAVSEIDGLIDQVGLEEGWPDSAPEAGLYTYVCYQERTLLAGETAAEEREYLEVLRLTVPREGGRMAIQVMPEAVEGLAGALPQVDLQGLLSFGCDAPGETAQALREPEKFAG